jgi:branched-chain amino acid transport system substrate-binding protein
VKKAYVFVSLAVLAAVAAVAIVFTAGAVASGASKSPIIVGMISGSTLPEFYEGTEAGAKYINKNLGGVAGHNIEIDYCATDGTPATTQACAEKFVGEKPAFVTVGLDNNMAIAYPLLAAANIPVLGTLPSVPTDYTAPNARYFIAGTLAAISGMAGYIAKFEPNVKNVGIAAFNAAVALQALPLIQNYLNKKGVKTETVTFDPTATDLTSTFVQLKNDGAQMIAVLASGPQCVGLAQAAQAQHVQMKFITASNSCYTPQIMQQAGPAMVGYILGGYSPLYTSNDPQAVLYRSQLQKYEGSKAVVNTYSELGFSTMVTIYKNILKPLGYSNLTMANILKKADSPKGGTAFLGPHYACGLDPKLPSLCSFGTQWYRITNTSGSLATATNNQYVNGLAPYLAATG